VEFLLPRKHLDQGDDHNDIPVMNPVFPAVVERMPTCGSVQSPKRAPPASRFRGKLAIWIFTLNPERIHKH
jgi:hypothetical protein